MGGDLLEISPRELQFAFEVKKQCSCLIHLTNKTEEYVAFKIKTTSPKRYCVRPNIGVISPKGTCDFTVIMQAQKTAPPDMQLKDKFLLQASIVPHGTTEEDVVADHFSKEGGRQIEESKLKVVLVSPVVHGSTEHPVELPVRGEESNVFLPQNSDFIKAAHELSEEPTFRLKEKLAISFQDSVDTTERTTIRKGLDGQVVEDVQNLKSKLYVLEAKLQEAEKTIVRMREEGKIKVQERDKLQNELVNLKRKVVPSVRVGFPVMFVVYMTLIGIVIGHLL